LLAKEYPPIYFTLPPDIKDANVVRFVIKPKYGFSAYEIFLTFEAFKILYILKKCGIQI